MSHKPWQPDAVPSLLSPAQVAAKFRKLIAAGCQLLPAGNAKPDPQQLLRGYLPKHRLQLFAHRYYLTNVRHDNQFRFFVAYVQLATGSSASPDSNIYPRIFYKDSSLIWRVATHYIKSAREHWIGKGDIKPVEENGEVHWYSAEETTNLPYEIQNALDAISRRVNTTRADRQALSLILRNAPDDRVIPYADFSRPRQSAMAAPEKRIHNNLPVAWFAQANDPRSLQFAPGYAPDFSTGFISGNESRSRLYGGRILRFRIAAHNRMIQYLFMRAPKISWIIPPQTLDDSIFNYGVRAVDVNVEENLCLPGYEYHIDKNNEDGIEGFSQIPAGFAGSTSVIDPQRADTAPWNLQMPVIKQFHRALPRLRKLAGL